VNAEELRAYILGKPEAVEEYPFGPGTAVFKVVGKIFALVPDDPPLTVSLKCEPFLATLLRENHPAVTPGYHLNKRHWNTVAVDGRLSDGELCEMIDHSYEQVVKGLPKRVQAELRGD
jgi:predicted DNA-binding protein (MmcQ/YjbR family)